MGGEWPCIVIMNLKFVRMHPRQRIVRMRVICWLRVRKVRPLFVIFVRRRMEVSALKIPTLLPVICGMGRGVFSHNGDLSDFHPELNDSFRPVGTTDSEVAFCWMLQQLSFQFGDQMPPLDELVSFLALLSRYVSLHGTFNYVLANGPLLIVHCSTELYWTERRFPYGVVELLDTGLKVDLNRLNQSDGAMTVLATHPLTRGEVWCPMGRGELRVYKDGELLHSKSAPSDAFPDEQVWSQRWKEGAIRLV